jgi:subtilisin-like proprotein convertase family protein
MESFLPIARVATVAAFASAILPLPATAGAALQREAEPNESATAANPIAGASAVIEGNVFPNGDADFFEFTAAMGDRIYAATMTGFSASGSNDSVLDLIGTDGTTVLETDDQDGSFGSASSSIAGFSIPVAGTYYLKVRHSSANSQLRPYRLFFQRRSGAPTAETEPNDAPGQALPAGGWVAGSTSSAFDLDLYTLFLEAGDTVFLSLDLDPERDTVEWNGQLSLGPIGGSFLEANDAGAATPDSEAFFLTVHDAATYTVRVRGGAGHFGTYHLSVTALSAANEGVDCTTYTSTDVPLPIPAGPGIVSSMLTVPGSPRIADLDVLIELTHSLMNNLDVELTAPTGNTVGLFSDIGSSTSGLDTTLDFTLDDEAGIPIGVFAVVAGANFTPELNHRLAWFDGQPAGGVWTLTVRDDLAADSGDLTGWSLRICQPSPPPSCFAGAVPVTVFSTDFETGDAGFTHAGTLDEWELGLPVFHPVTGCNSGTHCWKTDLSDTYAASSTQDLLSPSIDLTAFVPPIVVTWAQKYQMESSSFDRVLIEARQTGAPMNAVRLFDWLGPTMTTTVGSPSVTIQEAAGWGLVSARADALSGLHAELRFHLDSDPGVEFAGLAIDDVSVTACLPLLDVDGDGAVEALTDGLLVLRYLFGFRGAVLITGAVDLLGCSRCDDAAIESHLASILSLLDIDGDGAVEPLTDGLLVLRYIFGFRGAVLVAGAVDTLNCTRCGAPAIEAYLDPLVP